MADAQESSRHLLEPLSSRKAEVGVGNSGLVEQLINFFSLSFDRGCRRLGATPLVFLAFPACMKSFPRENKSCVSRECGSPPSLFEAQHYTRSDSRQFGVFHQFLESGGGFPGKSAKCLHFQYRGSLLLFFFFTSVPALRMYEV